MNSDAVVRTVELVPGYPVLEVDHPTCTARLALHGAHLMSWCPEGEEEVLYLSPDAVYREGKAIRGGIPICWPWFNAHPSDPELPSHGVARSQFWELLSKECDEEGVRLELGMKHEGWNLVARFRLGRELVVELESSNTSEVTQSLSGALHSYLQVGDVEEVIIKQLDGADYLDTVGERVMRKQKGEVRIGEEVDRIYESSGPVLLEDARLKRSLLVEKEGSPSTVVWNPWSEKAGALADLPDDGFRDFVCIEAAIANEKAVTVGPGKSHCLATRISVLR
ncbi:MAG: D-hexose-6-phosphate mutarotase [Verrucomicrobiota bacterium]